MNQQFLKVWEIQIKLLRYILTTNGGSNFKKRHSLIKIDLYRKDEPRGSAENKDDEQIYLSKSQINYPLFNVKLSGSKAAGLDLEPNSDYEVIFCYLLTYSI